MAVRKGDRIKVDYTGKLENGTVFDSSEAHGQPLEFDVGAGQMIPGFDEAVVGMEVGEEKEVTLAPKDAYGDHNPELIKEYPRDTFPKDVELKAGMTLGMALPNGAQVPATVTKVEGDRVTIDSNHPLAGKTLTFKIRIIAIG